MEEHTIISRSGLRPFWKSIFLLATLAAGVLPAVAQQQTEAQFEASVYSAIQPLLSQAPGSPIIMSSNVVLAQCAFIVSSAVTVQVLENYVDGLKAAGEIG